jgi:PKD repeat protein
MKKTYLLLFVFSFSLFTAYAQSGGNGTPGNPYQIKNCNDLQAMELHKASYWKMMNDVDCSATKTGTGQWDTHGFRPVGDSVGRFTGNFNGNCFSIENMYIDYPARNFVGLFGYTDSSAWIQDIEIINSEVTGKNHTGMAIGYKLSTYFDDGFTTGKVFGKNYTGGVVGASDNYQGTYSEITNVSSEADVNGTNFTGGIVGKITTFQGGSANVVNGFSTGNVTGHNSTGGIAGNCATYQGGGAELQYCYSTGTITGNDSTGGLAGSIGPFQGGGSDILQSYFTGTVNGHNAVGGLAGFSGPNSGGGSSLEKSYNQGNVTGNTNVGGIVGIAESTTIDSVYGSGVITGVTNKGGFVGNQSSNTYTGNYWDSVVNAPTLKSVGIIGNVAGIKPSGTVQMQTQVYYTNWNFVTLWKITAGNFPTLYPSPTNGSCNFPATLTAAFNMTPDSTCSGDTVQLFDRSTGTPTSWLWNFGDPGSGPNNTSNLQNPIHRFSVIGWYTVKEVISKGPNKDSIMSPIHIYCGVTGTNDIMKEESIRIYPNPSNGVFTVAISRDSYRDQLGIRNNVEVYNMLGEKVYNSTFITQNSPFTIDISSQPSGVYMYRIVDEKGQMAGTGRLIIR